MKIGIVCYPTHGGSGVVASELAIGLAKKGHEMHIVSYAPPFRLRSFHQNIFVHEVEVAAYPLFKYPPYELGLVTKLVELAESQGLDLIHAHYAVPHAASAYLAKQIFNSARLKTLTTLHGTDITLVGADPSFRRVVKFAIEKSDGVTAVSRYLRNRTVEEFDIRREIRVIPNFIEVVRASADLEACNREAFAPRGEKILMHASNFRPVKRIGDVVRIFARVRDRDPGQAPARRRGARAALHPAARERAQARRRRPFPGGAGPAGAALFLRRPVSPAERAGELRADGPRGHELRRPRDRQRRRRTARGRDATARPASFSRWAISPTWRRAPSRSSPTRSGMSFSAPGPGSAPRRFSTPTTSSLNTRRSMRSC